MSEFVGRTGALRLYSYPEPRRSGVSEPFARNFASGPETLTAIAGATDLPWNAISSGAPAGVNVPITPAVTGVVSVIAAVTIKNNNVSDLNVQIEVTVDGTPIAAPFFAATIPAGGGVIAIPVVAEVSALALGVASNIGIRATPTTDDSGLNFLATASGIEVREVPVATG